MNKGWRTMSGAERIEFMRRMSRDILFSANHNIPAEPDRPAHIRARERRYAGAFYEWAKRAELTGNTEARVPEW